jgi:hypothetical protein
MILRNGKFSGKILRKIFRTRKFSMENFPPHITNGNTPLQVYAALLAILFVLNGKELCGCLK